VTLELLRSLAAPLGKALLAEMSQSAARFTATRTVPRLFTAALPPASFPQEPLRRRTILLEPYTRALWLSLALALWGLPDSEPPIPKTPAARPESAGEKMLKNPLTFGRR